MIYYCPQAVTTKYAISSHINRMCLSASPPPFIQTCFHSIKCFQMLKNISGYVKPFSPVSLRFQDAIDYLNGQISSTRSWVEEEQKRIEKEFQEKMDHLSLAMKEKSVSCQYYGFWQSTNGQVLTALLYVLGCWEIGKRFLWSEVSWCRGEKKLLVSGNEMHIIYVIFPGASLACL